MAKFSSKAASVEAHVVTEDEAPIRVSTAKGQEHAGAGDAIVTVKKQTYLLPAAIFAALFEEDRERSSDREPKGSTDKEPERKGGQQKSETKG